MAKDSQIVERVRKAIACDETLRAMDIEVDVEAGVVTLRGAVDSEQSRQLAAGIAGTALDVEMVNNELKVKEELTP